jgi:hypothetical protein
MAAQRFMQNTRWCPFKIKKLCPAPQYWSITYQLIPLSAQQISLDSPFKMLLAVSELTKNVSELAISGLRKKLEVATSDDFINGRAK